jgi:hypothetical protein
MSRARVLADYVSSGDELADKAPLASPTFTGTVAIPNVANLETAVTANTAKVTNATHTGDVTGGTALTIANDAVDSQHYAAGSIDNEHLADDAVGSDELANDVVINTSGAITTTGALTSGTVIIGDTDMTAGHSAIVADRLHTESDSTTAAQFNTIINNSNITHNGLLVQAGNTSSETSFAVRKYNLTSDLFAVKGDGDVTVNTGNLVIGTSGKGIDFSATADTSTTGASMTSELLDDYEEGTWSGVVTDGTNNMTLNASYNSGYYTKIGNLVTLSGIYITTSAGSATGSLKMTGLPFTVVSQAAGYTGGCSPYGTSLVITAGHQVCYYAEVGLSEISLQIWDLTTGTSQLQASEWSADGGIMINMSYRAG